MAIDPHEEKTDPAGAGAHPRAPKAKRPFRWWLLGLGTVGVLGVLVALGGLIAYTVFSRGLPSIEWASHYRPPIVTEVWSGDQQLAGEFYNERRRVVPYERVPKKL